MADNTELKKFKDQMEIKLILLIGACRMPKVTKRQIEESLERFIQENLK